RRLGSSQPVVAVTNDRRLRRLCADSGCETPEVQWRRWSATRRRPALGFSGWVSTLKSGIFVEMLSSVPVGPLLPQLRSVHEEEMSARTTVGHSCFETREARRRAAQRLQETLQAINPDELAPVDGSLQAVLDEIRSELALREEKHPRRKERLSGL
ncbi:unnamed protein product, partial [Durusdinium trenchii]